MSVFHAICTGCGMSVHFERTREDVYACPYCGRSFSYAELSASCSLVNVEEARNEYVRAQHFFQSAITKTPNCCLIKCALWIAITFTPSIITDYAT